MFVLLACGLSLSKGIPKQYQKLAEEARRNARLIRSPAEEESIMNPGDYSFGGISFKLQKTLMSAKVPEVKGFAKSDDILAIVPSKNCLKSGILGQKPGFADPENQIIYTLDKVIAEEEDVILFKGLKANPLMIFGDLLMKTAATDKGYDCTLNESILTGAKCKAWFSYNWPTPGPGEDPLDLKPEYFNQSFHDIDIRAGAYAQAVGQVAIQFQGLFDVSAKFSVDIDAVGGVGFRLKQRILSTNIKLAEFTYPIYGISVKVLGIELFLGVDAFVGFELRNLSIVLPEVEYYRDLRIKFHKSGVLSTSGGYVGDPFTYSITSDPSSNIENMSIITYLEHLQLGVTPTVDAGIRIGIHVGALLESSMRVGAEFGLNMNFGMNTSLCTFPHLYGRTGCGLNAFVRGVGLNVLGINVVKPFDLTWHIFQSRQTPNICLFSSRKSAEGVLQFTSEARVPSVVVRPEAAFVPSDRTPTGKIEFETYLEAFGSPDAHSAYRSIQLPYLSFDSSQETKNVTSVMVLKDPLEQSVLKYTTVVDGDYLEFQDDFGVTEDFTRDICGRSDKHGLCVRTTLGRSAQVEQFKEFNSSSRFVSVEVNGTNGDLFGIITHGDDEAYAAPLARHAVVDDASYDGRDVRVGEYPYKRFSRITLKQFVYTDGKSGATNKGSLWFYRVKDGHDEALSKVSFPASKSNTANTPESLGIPEYAVPFELDAGFDLRVELSLSISGKQILKKFYFPAREFESKTSFILSKSDGESQITLYFTNTAPTVLFEVPDMDEFKGIVARIFQPTESYKGVSTTAEVSMRQDEIYGIARFFVQHPSSNLDTEKFSAVFNAKGVVPLCEYTALDDSHVLINIKKDETLFSAEEQTHYFDDVFTINIPFRRTETKPENFSITLIRAFVSDGQGLCSAAGTVRGHISQAVQAGCVDLYENSESTDLQPLVLKGAQLAEGGFAIPGKFRVRTFAPLTLTNGLSEVEMVIRDVNLTIGPNTSSIFVGKERVQEQIDANKKIVVNCPKCSSVRIESASFVKRLEKVFEFAPTEAEDLIFIAECDNSNNAFCEFDEDFSEDGVALLKYRGDGVLDVTDNNKNKLLSGVTRQIVHDRTKARIIKHWEGEIERVATNLKRAPLIIMLSKNATHTRVEAKFGGLSIPLSASRFRTATEEFLGALGIEEPSQGFTDGDLWFSADGVVTVRTELLGQRHTALRAANSSVLAADQSLLALVDVPNELIESVSFGDDNSKLSVGAIAGITAGAVLICVAVVVGIIKFQQRRRSEPLLESLGTIESHYT